MVFYFSGTGNSQLVAVRIAEMTGDKAVSINRYMKKGEKRCSVRNAAGICCSCIFLASAKGGGAMDYGE